MLEEIKKILPCICSEAHTTRGLKDPTCPQCNYAVDIALYLNREIQQQLAVISFRVGNVLGKTSHELENKLNNEIMNPGKETEG